MFHCQWIPAGRRPDLDASLLRFPPRGCVAEGERLRMSGSRPEQHTNRWIAYPNTQCWRRVLDGRKGVLLAAMRVRQHDPTGSVSQGRAHCASDQRGERGTLSAVTVHAPAKQPVGITRVSWGAEAEPHRGPEAPSTRAVMCGWPLAGNGLPCTSSASSALRAMDGRPSPTMSASVRTLCLHGASPCLGRSQSQKLKVTASPRGGVGSNRR